MEVHVQYFVIFSLFPDANNSAKNIPVWGTVQTKYLMSTPDLPWL